MSIDTLNSAKPALKSLPLPAKAPVAAAPLVMSADKAKFSEKTAQKFDMAAAKVKLVNLDKRTAGGFLLLLCAGAPWFAVCTIPYMAAGTIPFQGLALYGCAAAAVALAVVGLRIAFKAAYARSLVQIEVNKNK